MSRLREENESEKVLFEIRFLFPILLMVLLWLIPLGCLINIIIFAVMGLGMGTIPFIVLMVVSLPLIIVSIILVNTSWCKVSNRRVFGYVKYPFGRRPFSFKLDEIVGVELRGFFGFRILHIKVSHGNGDSETIKLHFIRNANDVYFTLVKMMNEVRCDTDVLLESINQKKK